MFGFLKKRIKSAISKISEKVRKEEIEERPDEHPKEDVKEEPKQDEEIKESKEESKKELDEIEREKRIDKEEVKEKETEKYDESKEEKGFLKKIKERVVTKKINERQFEDFFYDLEIALMENNVAVEVIEKIKDDLKKDVVDIPIKRGKIEEKIMQSLKISISSLFKEPFNLIKNIKRKKPYVICFFGVNGSGKTTTIAKLAKMLKGEGFSIVLAASDTFRAASIEQMQMHADNLGIKLIKHDYGSDPAAVAYDAIQHAKSKGIDIVIIDTAGRMHSNTNLIDEMKKISKVSNPDLKIFLGESITGNDCVEQARAFDDAIGIDCIILSKADIDEKGGAAVSISYVMQKPIIFLGTGQEYDDLQKFDSQLIINNLGLE